MILREGVFVVRSSHAQRQEYLARKEPLLGWVIGDLPGNISHEKPDDFVSV